MLHRKLFFYYFFENEIIFSKSFAIPNTCVGIIQSTLSIFLPIFFISIENDFVSISLKIVLSPNHLQALGVET